MRASRQRLSGQSRARPLVMLGLVGVAVLVVWWLAMSPPAPPEQSSFPPPGAAGGAGDTVPADPSKPAAQPSPLTAGQQPPSRTTEQQQLAITEQTEPALNIAVPVRQGPVDELSKRYAGESRGADSDKEEARVRAAFSDPAIPSDMLHSVECRRSACRLELRWRAQHDAAYVLGLTRALGSFSVPLGIEGAGPPDHEGARPLALYFGLSR